MPAITFWCEVGNRLGIKGIPESYEKFRQFAFDYERDNFVFAEKHTKIDHVFARHGLCRVTEYHSFRTIDDSQ